MTPVWLVRPKRWASAGRRMSIPTTITRLPESAYVMARLVATKVLPSPEILDVISITRFSPPLWVKLMLLRSRRKSSAMGVLMFSPTTMGELPLVGSSHISPRIGTEVRRSSSSWSLNTGKSIRRRNITSAGISKPISNATPYIIDDSGATGP